MLLPAGKRSGDGDLADPAPRSAVVLALVGRIEVVIVVAFEFFCVGLLDSLALLPRSILVVGLRAFSLSGWVGLSCRLSGTCTTATAF